MKYWLLTSEYPPFFGGGISTYCRLTARMLNGNGHDVTVFVNDDTIRNTKVEIIGNIRVIRFNPSSTNSSTFLGHTTNISYEFANIIKHFIAQEGKPDIIESQEYLGIAYYLLQYKHLHYSWCEDIPILITMHSPSFLYMEYNQVSMYRYPNYWICEMERFCIQSADYIISPSQFMIDELLKRFKLTNKNISVVPNPYSIPRDHEPKDLENADQIVFYGKLTAQKGAFQLLKYFKDLWDNGFNETLYLLGGQDIVYHPDGMTMGDIIRKRFGQYIQRGLLKLEDKISPSKIAGRLARAKLVIVPSNNDNLPYVVFEMMGLGKLLLVSKQGGHCEVIRDNIDGFIFDHEEEGSFRQKLELALNLKKDDRKQIILNSLSRVSNDYNEDVIYKRKIIIIEEIVSRKATKKRVFPFIRNSQENVLGTVIESVVEARLSIVIPYFNLGQFLDATINSILRSNYPEKEIIIVNDGSTDPFSIDQLNKFRTHPLVTVIDIPNSGLAEARNKGALAASGEYLAFLDADDTIEPDYYTRAVKVLSHYTNVHFVGSWIQYTGDSNKVWPAFMPEPPIILYHNTINSSALVYKRMSFLQAGQNDSQMKFQGWEDYDSVISMIDSGFNGVVLPERLFNYHIRQDSMVRGLSKEKKLFLYQYISNKHSMFYAKFAPDLFNLLNANGTGVLMDNPSLDHHLTDKIPFGGNLSLKLIKIIKRNKYAKLIAYKIYRLLNK